MPNRGKPLAGQRSLTSAPLRAGPRAAGCRQAARRERFRRRARERKSARRARSGCAENRPAPRRTNHKRNHGQNRHQGQGQEARDSVDHNTPRERVLRPRSHGSAAAAAATRGPGRRLISSRDQRYRARRRAARAAPSGRFLVSAVHEGSAARVACTTSPRGASADAALEIFQKKHAALALL